MWCEPQLLHIHIFIVSPLAHIRFFMNVSSGHPSCQVKAAARGSALPEINVFSGRPVQRPTCIETHKYRCRSDMAY